MKLVILLALLISVSYSFEGYCNCGETHTFHQYTYTCLQNPQPSQEGYVDGCKHYQLNTSQQVKWKCVACQSQYILQKGICIDTGIPGCISGRKVQNSPIEENFLATNGDGYQCTACDSKDYYLHDYNCIKYPQKGNRYYIKGCDIYFSKGKCLTCQQGYYRDHFYCRKAQHLIDNCRVYEDSNKCQQCEDGYVINGTKCYKPEQVISNCEKAYNNQGQVFCFQCQSGYIQTYQKCIPDPTTEQNGKIENCTKYSMINNQIKCVQCSNNYALSKDQYFCLDLEIKPINNCYAYKIGKRGYQQCATCSDGFNPQYDVNDIKDCKKCPAIPKQQFNLEQQDQQYNIIDMLLDTLLEFQKLF